VMGPKVQEDVHFALMMPSVHLTAIPKSRFHSKFPKEFLFTKNDTGGLQNTWLIFRLFPIRMLP